jgi:hypothetical protein
VRFPEAYAPAQRQAVVVDDEELQAHHAEASGHVQAWIDAQQSMQVLYLNYADILAGPAQSLSISMPSLGQLDVGRMARSSIRISTKKIGTSGMF